MDSRPSDAIALAVRAHVPIFVDESVMQSAGITPEADVEAHPGGRPADQAQPSRCPPVGEVSKERLSVFEDFLGKLDLDKLDKGKPKGEDKGSDDRPGTGSDPDAAESPTSPRGRRRNDRVPSG